MESPLIRKIYKSSAGSGKTWTLVMEWLCIVLPYPDRFRQVLAITFTNKAAAEMRNRVISALSELSRGKGDDIRLEVVKRTGMKEGDVRIKATHTLGLILHHFGEFSVSTIDSFTHRILRAFSRELGLPETFSVELDSDSLAREISDRLLARVGNDPYVTEILTRFLEERILNESDLKIEKDVNRVTKTLFSEAAIPHLEALSQFGEDEFRALIRELNIIQNAYLKQVKEQVEVCMRHIKASGLNPDDWPGKSRGAGAYFEKLSGNVNAESIKGFRGYSSIGKLFVEKEYGKPGKGSYELIQALIEGSSAEDFTKLWDLLQEGYRRFTTAQVAYRNIYSLAVVSKLEQILEEWRAEESALHISDFNKKISQFIRDESPEYLYWRLGERYRFFLLDEFQDTSALQWENMLPLFENLLAGAEDEGGIVIVGDSKQAIYRWRAGKLELLEQMAPRVLRTESLTLSENFRSGEAIVNFNNQLFSEGLKNFGDQDLLHGIYSTVAQNIRPGKRGMGFVEIKEIEGDQWKDEWPVHCIEKVLDLIREGFRKKDIAILVRGNEEGGRFARELFEAGIAVISPDSLQLSSAPEVRFLISLFRFLLHPNDRISKSEVLSFYHAYLLKDPSPAEKVMDLLDKPFTLDDGTGFPASEILNQPPYEMAERLLRLFGLQDKGGAFLLHFLFLIHDFCTTQTPDLAAFMEFWDEEGCKKSLAVPENEDAVQIMTIHRSKGLQFPVVIIPKADWTLAIKKNSLAWGRPSTCFLHPDETFLLPLGKSLIGTEFEPVLQRENELTLTDNINLAYVAFTRPEARLYIQIPARDSKSENAKEQSLENVNEWLKECIDAGLLGLVWSDVWHAWTGGKIQPPEKQDQGTESPKHPGFISGNWEQFVSIREVSKELNKEAKADALDFVLCEILRRLPDQKNLDEVLNELYAEGFFVADERQNIMNAAHQLIPGSGWLQLSDSRDRIAPVFAVPGSFPGKSDRLHWNGNSFTIVQCSHSEESTERGKMEGLRLKKILTDTLKLEGEIRLIRIKNQKAEILKT